MRSFLENMLANNFIGIADKLALKLVQAYIDTVF